VLSPTDNLSKHGLRCSIRTRVGRNALHNSVPTKQGGLVSATHWLPCWTINWLDLTTRTSLAMPDNFDGLSSYTKVQYVESRQPSWKAVTNADSPSDALVNVRRQTGSTTRNPGARAWMTVEDEHTSRGLSERIQRSQWHLWLASRVPKKYLGRVEVKARAFFRGGDDISSILGKGRYHWLLQRCDEANAMVQFCQRSERLDYSTLHNDGAEMAAPMTRAAMDD